MKVHVSKLGERPPKLDSEHVDVLLEDVIGCRWSVSVLRAVASGVKRPGALERHIEGSSKVLTDQLQRFHRAGIFERVLFPEIPPRLEYRLTYIGEKFTKLLKEVDQRILNIGGCRVIF